MRHEERINRLERDLAKLEGIVDTMVSAMESEHRAMRDNRQEDRKALKELGEKMEKSVAMLATEIKALAEQGARTDSQVLAKQAQAVGALSFGRWVIATAIALAAMFSAYQAGKDGGSQNEGAKEVRQLLL